MDYSEKVMDHFANPRNSRKMEDANGVGTVGNPTCGDLMTIYIKVEDNVIQDISFQTFGCGAAIATSSMITEIAVGKTLEEALEISRNEIKIPIQYQYVDDAFRKLLNVGATINQIEVIRNFNGWSWNISSNMRNYEYNIIYQTLNYIVGYDLLYEFIDNNNITLDYIKILNEQVVLKMRKQNRKRI